ncbi:phage protease [Primorskyibacter sp. 2E233]|uniref:phage protease n=1 Tax=Primorskyibacter sp. 2E233 TaxID=3413431 RepID=UPI003BEFC4D8
MGPTFTVQCDNALPYAPDWVQLTPLGAITARDGRNFVVDDPDAILAAFAAGGIDLPIDYEHQNDNPKAKLSGPVPAAGWIKELATRADGIWGRVEWTDRASAMIAAREYRFLSPTLIIEKNSGQVALIRGAALVHNPALHIKALAAQEDTMPDPTTPKTAPDMTGLMARLAKLVGLDEDATEEDLFAALRQRLDGANPDPSKFAPIEALREAMNDRNKELATFREERAQRKVNDAWNAGYLTTGGKAWALELCMKDEASFDAFIANTAPAYAHLTTSVVPKGIPGMSKPEHSAEVMLLSEQLGVTPERLIGD